MMWLTERWVLLGAERGWLLWRRLALLVEGRLVGLHRKEVVDTVAATSSADHIVEVLAATANADQIVAAVATEIVGASEVVLHSY